jgi:hypothetical protein
VLPDPPLCCSAEPLRCFRYRFTRGESGQGYYADQKELKKFPPKAAAAAMVVKPRAAAVQKPPMAATPWEGAEGVPEQFVQYLTALRYLQPNPIQQRCESRGERRGRVVGCFFLCEARSGFAGRHHLGALPPLWLPYALSQPESSTHLRTVYSDAKVANRNAKVGHGATENGSRTTDKSQNFAACM